MAPGVVVRREQRRRASEEVDRTDHVGSIECANARHAEPGGSARRQCSAGSAELFIEPRGLLEVVAEHLVELDEAVPVLVEPVRESLVELGPGGLRQGFVGRVSAEEMTEAECLLVGEQRRSERMSSLRTSVVRRAVSSFSSGLRARTAP